MALLQRKPPAARPQLRLIRPRSRDDALTAAAAKAQDSPGLLRRLDLPWQQEALRMYDLVGECWNPTQYQARAMERIRYFPAMRQTDGSLQEVTDGPLLDLWNRIRSPAGAPGDLSEIAGQFARLQDLIGDGLLTVSTQQGDEAWEYLSTLEMRVDRTDAGQPQKYRRIKAPGLTPDQLTEAPDDEFSAEGIDQARVWRLWRRHPTYSQWSDSPVRPIIDLYTLLNRLTLAVMAEASSRAAQRGLLFWPNELTNPSVRPEQEENPEENPIAREFRLSVTRAIQNPGSAEAMSPFFLFGPGVTSTSSGPMATADLIKWIALGSNERYAEGEMWDKTVSRIAASRDLPKEMLTGIEDLSHWSAWFLDEIGFRQHTGPTVLRFCNGIASAYLRPAAMDPRSGVENADRVAVGFDASKAINHPDETGVAMQAHDRLIVSDKFARSKIGANEGDKPDESEYARRAAIKLRQFPSDLEREVGGTVTESGVEVAPGDGTSEKAPPAGTTTRPPGTRAPAPSGPNMALIYKVAGAAEMQIERARELAGNKLMRRAQSCDECKDRIVQVPREQVAATLGAELVREWYDHDEASLVRGVGHALAKLMDGWGIDGGMPEQIGQMVEQHALRTLYEREVPPLPPGVLSAITRACA